MVIHPKREHTKDRSLRAGLFSFIKANYMMILCAARVGYQLSRMVPKRLGEAI